jgi:hypothetical protein
MAKRGHPKTFKSGADLIGLWRAFCDEIKNNEFKGVPTQTAFCRWLAENYDTVDRKTIYTSLNKYFPDIKKEFESLQSDTIMEGAMLGKYNATMSIFGLKNWCNWKDKAEPETTAATEEQAKMLDAIKKAVTNADK